MCLNLLWDWVCVNAPLVSYHISVLQKHIQRFGINIHLVDTFVQSDLQLFTDGSGSHARCRPAHQEQFGVQCLAQGHFNKQTRGNRTSDPMIINAGSNPEPQPPNVYPYIYIYDNHSWYTLLQGLFTHPMSHHLHSIFILLLALFLVSTMSLGKCLPS